MNKVRYVQQKAPPAVAAFADIQRVLDAMLERSWAGVAKKPIVIKEKKKEK
jgi:hypothetical protein